MATHTYLSDFIGTTQISDSSLTHLIESGLPLESVAKLRESGLTYAEESDIVISPRILKRRKGGVETVFSTRVKARPWLRTPDKRLFHLRLHRANRSLP